jgi:hypothetical protein
MWGLSGAGEDSLPNLDEAILPGSGKAAFPHAAIEVSVAMADANRPPAVPDGAPEWDVSESALRHVEDIRENWR